MLGSSLLLALAGSAIAAPASDLLASRQIDAPCVDGIHLIVVGGAGQAGVDPYTMGYLQSLSDSILQRIPGSSSRSVPYDKANVRGNPAIVGEATQTLNQYINDYHYVCPNTKIALLGYSSGAVATMNGLCNGVVDQGLANSAVVATVVYGDQTRSQNAPYNYGTCTASGGRSPRADPASCGAFSIGIQSFCQADDIECCQATGSGDPNAHFAYPGLYDGDATSWVEYRFHNA